MRRDPRLRLPPGPAVRLRARQLPPAAGAPCQRRRRLFGRSQRLPVPGALAHDVAARREGGVPRGLQRRRHHRLERLGALGQPHAAGRRRSVPLDHLLQDVPDHQERPGVHHLPADGGDRPRDPQCRGRHPPAHLPGRLAIPGPRRPLPVDGPGQSAARRQTPPAARHRRVRTPLRHDRQLSRQHRRRLSRQPRLGPVVHDRHGLGSLGRRATLRRRARPGLGTGALPAARGSDDAHGARGQDPARRQHPHLQRRRPRFRRHRRAGGALLRAAAHGGVAQGEGHHAHHRRDERHAHRRAAAVLRVVPLRLRPHRPADAAPQDGRWRPRPPLRRAVRARLRDRLEHPRRLRVRAPRVRGQLPRGLPRHRRPDLSGLAALSLLP